MDDPVDTKPKAISFISPVAPKVPSEPGLTPGSPAQRKHGVILEAVRQQHTLESLQPPVSSTHELQYAHAQIRLLEQKAAMQEQEMNSRLQQLEHVAAMSLAAKQPPPFIATVSPPTATVHPSLSTVGGDPDLVTSLFTAAGFSKNSAGDWTKPSAISPGSVPPCAVVDPSQAFPMGINPLYQGHSCLWRECQNGFGKGVGGTLPIWYTKGLSRRSRRNATPDVLAAIPGMYSSLIAEDSDLSDQLGLMLTSVVHG